jgi:hypothetical protein
MGSEVDAVGRWVQKPVVKGGQDCGFPDQQVQGRMQAKWLRAASMTARTNREPIPFRRSSTVTWRWLSLLRIKDLARLSKMVKFHSDRHKLGLDRLEVPFSPPPDVQLR